MKKTPNQRRQGMETIEDTDQMYTIVIRLARSKESTRGCQEYRRTLKAIIGQCESRLGNYRRPKK
jgi:hypothetical protein